MRKNAYPGIEFGTLLQRVLKDVHISRDSLAENLQCSIDAVDNWCSGRARISARNAGQLCFFLMKKGVPTRIAKELYGEALRVHGFSPSWPPDATPHTPITMCVLGALTHRKELSLMESIIDNLSGVGQTGFIVQGGPNVDTLLSVVDLADRVGVANLVLCGVRASPDFYRLVLDKFAGQDTLVLLILTDCPDEIVRAYDNVYSIGWSFFGLAYKATHLLIAAGHTRIGTVHVETETSRFLGYLQALRDNDIDPDPELILDGGPLAEYKRITDQNFIRRLERFVLQDKMTAIFAPTETHTLMIPVLLLKNGKMLYHDVSLCGLANKGWIGQGVDLPISYICYPNEEMARQIGNILLRWATTGADTGCDRVIDITQTAELAHNGRWGSIRQITNSDAPTLHGEACPRLTHTQC